MTVTALRWVSVVVGVLLVSESAVVDESGSSIAAVGVAVVVAIWWTMRREPVRRLPDLVATVVLVGASLLADPATAFLPAAGVSLLIVLFGPALLSATADEGVDADVMNGEADATAPISALPLPRAEPEDVQRAVRLNERVAEWLTYARSSLDRHLDRIPDDGLKDLRDELDGAIDEVEERTRQMRARITPAEPLSAHLSRVLDWWSEHYGCEVVLRVIDPEARLNEAVEQELLTILLEAIDNAGRHARADQLSVRWEIIGDDGVLRIADDGVGFDTFSTTGPGLDAMFRAAGRIGRDMRIDSMPGEGTVVIVRATDRA